MLSRKLIKTFFNSNVNGIAESIYSAIQKLNRRFRDLLNSELFAETSPIYQERARLLSGVAEQVINTHYQTFFLAHPAIFHGKGFMSADTLKLNNS